MDRQRGRVIERGGQTERGEALHAVSMTLIEAGMRCGQLDVCLSEPVHQVTTERSSCGTLSLPPSISLIEPR